MALNQTANFDGVLAPAGTSLVAELLVKPLEVTIRYRLANTVIATETAPTPSPQASDMITGYDTTTGTLRAAGETRALGVSINSTQTIGDLFSIV